MKDSRAPRQFPGGTRLSATGCWGSDYDESMSRPNEGGGGSGDRRIERDRQVFQDAHIVVGLARASISRSHEREGQSSRRRDDRDNVESAGAVKGAPGLNWWLAQVIWTDQSN